MLSIGKLAKGQQGYYLDAVARGAEDYYLDGEAPGRWLGVGAEQLELIEEVDGDALAAILDGRDPRSGTRLRASGSRVPGFDLTFRAPKSVSVIFGLGEPELASAVADAHDAAVTAAIGYLERHATWTRRGHGGVEQIRADGLVGAAFRHRTSRAGDPHLHTHVLVANAVRGADGRWSTIDARHLYWHARTAGFLYEAHLRSELTARLGVAWCTPVNGIGDIEGIPQDVLRAFSTRRAEIEEQLEAKGWTSARAAEIATLETRKAKQHDVDANALRRDWRERALGLGFGPARLAVVLGSPRRAPLDPVAIRTVEEELLSPAGLTAHASSFDRRDVLRAWADRLPGGASTDEIEAVADRLLCHPEVVALAARTDETIRSDSGRVISRTSTGSRWSTKGLLALERTTVDRALARRHTRVGLADSLAIVLATHGLPADQQRVVEHLATSGNGVDVLAAPAGSGKTYTLAVARQAWEESGYCVIGAALAARAAAELQSSAGIPSSTLTRLISSLDRTPMGGNTILVIDLCRHRDYADRPVAGQRSRWGC